MPTYVLLDHFTDQGIRNVKDTLKRSQTFRQLAKKHGATVREVFWTQGQYDVVSIVEAPDDQAVAALSLSVESAGNVRIQTLRAFTAEEMEKILGKVNQREAPAAD
jgi:uncharacterized protein with GYD domain